MAKYFPIFPNLLILAYYTFSSSLVDFIPQFVLVFDKSKKYSFCRRKWDYSCGLAEFNIYLFLLFQQYSESWQDQALEGCYTGNDKRQNWKTLSKRHVGIFWASYEVAHNSKSRWTYYRLDCVQRRQSSISVPYFTISN